jgi:hypothetical protein
LDIKLEIPDYDPNCGIKYKWELNFDIEIKSENKTIILTANSAGLRSLANHFLNLAQKEVPSGTHLHFDEYNALEEGSLELIIQKK